MSPEGNSLSKTVKEQYETLSRVHRRIAKWLIQNPSKALELNLDEMATATGSSRSTILRFCQTIGVEGFKDLKAMLAQPVNHSLQHVADDDVLEWVYVSTETALRDTFSQLAPEVFHAAAQNCSQARQIVWFGSLESGYMARCSAHKCSLLGIESLAYSEHRSFQNNVRFITSQDVLIAISWGGDGDHIRGPLEQARIRGVPIIGLTADPLSRLAEIADWALVAGNQHAVHDQRQITIRAGQEALANALIFKVASLRGTRWKLP